MGKIESAEPLLKLIITALSNLDHVEATHLTRSLYLLAENQRLQKKFTEATEYYAKVREIEEQELGPEHPEMASTYYGLGMAIYGVGNYAEAENYFQKTLNIELQELGEEDSEIAITLLWLGESQFNQAKFDDAEQNLQRALSLQITQNSERDVSLKPVLELLRDVSHALGKEVEARDYAEKINMLDG
jgi:tetratricopeptide (TPR) repeat protein